MKQITASEMGRRGGLARAKKLSKQRRRDLARAAALARWAKAKKGAAG